MNDEPTGNPRRLATGARRVAGSAARGTVRSAGRAGRATWTAAQRAATAEGAGQTGLSRLIALHACNAAGDAAVAISLAGTLFFQVPTGEARGQVALFLALTMLPFAVLAPLIGPFLDRVGHGRRWAIGSTMAMRAFLCWVLATAVVTGSTWLFPAALGVLVASKAYGVTKASAAPRLLPPGLTLVKANARISLAGVLGASLSAPLAGLAAMGGSEWSLRYAFVVFVIATILAIRLPARVDSAAGEVRLELLGGPSSATHGEGDGPGRTRRRGSPIPPSVAFTLRATCGPRWLSGFLTMFMAFLLREHPVDGWSARPELLLGAVIGAAGLGNTAGIALASLARRIDPRVTVVLALLGASTMTLVAALFYGLPSLLALGLVAGLAQSLSKLSLDSTIQRDVPERVHASAFARSDTLLQLAWVVGGGIGIVMPLQPRLGLGIAVGLLTAWTVFVLVTNPQRAARRP